MSQNDSCCDRTQKLSPHHLLARYRDGKDKNNLVKLPRFIHAAWHQLFDLLTPSEAIELITEVFSQYEFDSEQVANSFCETHVAWRQIFGSLTPPEAIMFITMVFVPNLEFTENDLLIIRNLIAEQSAGRLLKKVS